jgi:hypothetical protein
VGRLGRILGARSTGLRWLKGERRDRRNRSVCGERTWKWMTRVRRTGDGGERRGAAWQKQQDEVYAGSSVPGMARMDNMWFFSLYDFLMFRTLFLISVSFPCLFLFFIYVSDYVSVNSMRLGGFVVCL